MSRSETPVVVFAYARPAHLNRLLGCLRADHVPLIYAFIDGARNADIEPRVDRVRAILRQVDWCQIHLVEREENLGLGASIIRGVGEVLEKHDRLIVFEDDLVCVPGTYHYLAAALQRYEDDPMVMSVTGWTHPLVTPSTVTDQPYFDGRAESWSWGTWARAWKGMDQDAASLVNSCLEKNIDIMRYGADLLAMAKVERASNIWAVRFAYLHLLRGGLCMRPPRSLVAHEGFDEYGTNAIGPSKWAITALDIAPELPKAWPPAVENPECPGLWQRECPPEPTVKLSGLRSLRHHISDQARATVQKLRKSRESK